MKKNKLKQINKGIFIPFPKIGALKQIVQSVNHTAHYVGQDDNDDPIYDPTIKNPILKFNGTVKLHGTNAGVSYSRKDGIYAQSRERTIAVEDDNFGFAMFVEKNKEIFMKMFEQLSEYIVDDNTVLTIFGEWAGKGIQSTVALRDVEKFFGIFAIKISESLENRYFLSDDVIKNFKSIDNRIFNTRDWASWEIDLDFDNLERSISTLVDLTNKVEELCPVGDYFGIKGLGEGIVWLHQSEKYGVIRFKVKGKKHSNTKTKTIVAIDPEVLESIEDFVEYSVTENRLQQGFDIIFTSKGLDIDIKQMGNFLKWITKDIISEELDVMIESNLEPKQVNKFISKKAREWFMVKWNKF